MPLLWEEVVATSREITIKRRRFYERFIKIVDSADEEERVWYYNENSLKIGMTGNVIDILSEKYIQELSKEQKTKLKNMSFVLVESLPEPPYAILFVFYALAFVLIAFVILGIYGNRKYKNMD